MQMIVGIVSALLTIASAQSFTEPNDKDGLYEWLASDDHIKRPLAANVLWEKFPEERGRLQKKLDEDLKSPNKDRRVQAALFLRKHYPDEKNSLFNAMEKDSDSEVRVRIAYRFLMDYKDERAKHVLEEVIRTADVHTHHGAESAVMASNGLQEGAGAVVGIDRALEVLSAPDDWFADIKSSPHEYSLRGTVKAMAASWLVHNRDKVPKEKLEDGLTFHLNETESRIKASTNDKERKYWEGHLPSTLELAVKHGMNDIARSHAGSVNLIKDKGHKRWMEAVIKKAENKTE